VRDALVESLGRDAEADRSATLVAIGGIMARVPSDAAVATLKGALDLAPGPERDALILAIGRANTPGAQPVLRGLLASPNVDDRRTLATVLAARAGSGAAPAVEMLGALLRDADPAVRAEAAWSLGEIGGLAELPALRGVFAAPDAAPAIDATAAIARILASARKPEAAATELCPLLGDDRAYVRANALAGLALVGSRCGDGAVERRRLLTDVTAVRASAARAIAQRSLGPEDLGALERCRATDASGAVASLCRAVKAPAPAPTPGASGGVPPREAVEVYVVGDVGKAPEPAAPYVLSLSDGFLRAGKCDRRGATFEAAAPGGDVSLLRLR
jgi:HEAT repeat protein